MKLPMKKRLFRVCDQCKCRIKGELFAYKDSKRKGFYCAECYEEINTRNYQWDVLENNV